MLQTESYAREHIRAGLPAAPHDEVEALVASRMDRQYIFARADPPFYWAIMDEAAFRRPTGDKTVMCEQLEHILRFAENPHVTVQVLPFVEGLHPMLGGESDLAYAGERHNGWFGGEFRHGRPRRLAEADRRAHPAI
ncbi:DUF5753 domain-containing protein [Streptomyces sp. NRRL F-2890]|uniref:DUF5753 domain-containing protein n=1 Tax=Streptomyces sp. NRRL F-2890 TaxID=1463845 RepID=UPI001F39E295|nr:DUF5753 domain-containing protein [Streptomyces sp. NRRL F-2890]